MIDKRAADKLASAELLSSLYETQHYHWWSVGMRAVTRALLDGLTLPEGPILEIGCGGGAFLDVLAARYPTHPVLGTDLNPVALAHARQGHTVFQADMHTLPLPAASIGTLIALDCVDQEGVDMDRALNEARRVLRPGGLLLLRVSAYDWLRGPHDVAFGTGRRHDAGDLRAAFARAGLAAVRLSYANSLLLLPAIAVRLAQQVGYSSVESYMETQEPLNTLFKRILLTEAQWLRHHSLPAGLSLYAIATRNE